MSVSATFSLPQTFLKIFLFYKYFDGNLSDKLYFLVRDFMNLSVLLDGQIGLIISMLKFLVVTEKFSANFFSLGLLAYGTLL